MQRAYACAARAIDMSKSKYLLRYLVLRKYGKPPAVDGSGSQSRRERQQSSRESSRRDGESTPHTRPARRGQCSSSADNLSKRLGLAPARLCVDDITPERRLAVEIVSARASRARQDDQWPPAPPQQLSRYLRGLEGRNGPRRKDEQYAGSSTRRRSSHLIRLLRL